MNTLTDHSENSILHGVQQILEAFRLNWKLFLGIHISVNILSLLVLTPIFTLLTGWLLLASGQTALTDEDILFFVLSPTGLMVMLLTGALYINVVVFELAAMITAADRLTSAKAVSIPILGRYLLVKALPLFRLALRMVGLTTLIAAPFLALTALIYYFFLTEFDINYYLTFRPPVFWWAGGLILISLLSLVGSLLRTFSTWVLALPLLLINHEKPIRALRKSRQASVSNRFPIAVTLLALFLLNTGMLGLVSISTEFVVDGVISLAGDSLQVMAYLLGGLLLVWLLANVTITFFSSSVLSLVILYLFKWLIRTTNNEAINTNTVPAHAGRVWHISSIRLVIITLLLSLAASLAISFTINRLNIEDHTKIIAHRGASADAPENTLAALELAINEGADWVEIDVQETGDGEIVVIHDSDLKKIAGSALKVSESTLAELQSVDIGSWKDPSFSDQRIPSLQQVLDLCKNRINIVIELKYYGKEQYLEEHVAKLVEAAGMKDQIVVMSLSYPGIRKMKSIRPDWMVGLLASVTIGDITRLEADFFAVNAKFTTRAFIKHVHRQNRKIMVWTVNDPISMSAMMSKGVDGIITDKPALASAIRNERAELSMYQRFIIQLASFIGKEPTRPVQ